MDDLKRIKQLAGIPSLTEADIVNLDDKRAKKKAEQSLTSIQKRHLDVLMGRMRIIHDAIYELSRFAETGKRVAKIDIPEIDEDINKLKVTLQELERRIARAYYKK